MRCRDWERDGGRPQEQVRRRARAGEHARRRLRVCSRRSQRGHERNQRVRACVRADGQRQDAHHAGRGSEAPGAGHGRGRRGGRRGRRRSHAARGLLGRHTARCRAPLCAGGHRRGRGGRGFRGNEPGQGRAGKGGGGGGARRSRRRCRQGRAALIVHHHRGVLVHAALQRERAGLAAARPGGQAADDSRAKAGAPGRGVRQGPFRSARHQRRRRHATARGWQAKPQGPRHGVQ
mmetsp:Transcript_376/g.1318  ORF Transcript_376/g.1318 Transcript_376/m.1318 type:complete len:234 (+) Transcript_376:239-940(+)